MKIGHNPELANAIAQNAPAKQQAKDAAPVAQAATQSTAASRSGAAVTFSSAARTLDANTRTQGDFDAGKVRAMREAIEKGTFKNFILLVGREINIKSSFSDSNFFYTESGCLYFYADHTK